MFWCKILTNNINNFVIKKNIFYIKLAVQKHTF